MAQQGRPLEGKLALVTGAARNLPAVIACELGNAGANVVVMDVTAEDELHAVVGSIRQTGSNAIAILADICRRDHLSEMVGQVRRELGTIDILVNGVGPFTLDSFMDLPEKTWDLVMDANLRAIWRLAQLVAPDMREKGWGRIISVSGGDADFRMNVYGLAKSGVRYLTECLAVELGPAVTVNNISPGQIAESAEEISAHDPTHVERSIKRTPAGRLVTRRELARMVVLICSSPPFESVTGATIKMDGGSSIPRW